MARVSSKTDSLRIQSTEDGLHLRSTILWLDAYTHGQLSFISAAHDVTRAILPQIISTEETIKIFESFRRKPNALVCQYNRPFSIGRLRMELLPSGHALGGASLYVETDFGPLLYAPYLQTQKIPTVRQMQLQRAKVLIVGAHHPDPQAVLPNRKKEKDRLLATLKAACQGGQWPIVVCETVGVAQELSQCLSAQDLPLAVHPAIYKVNKVYEDYGVDVGSFSLLSLKRSRQKVILFPLANAQRGHLPRLADRPVYLVRSTSTEAYAFKGSERVSETFYLGLTCDGVELQQAIAQVKPKDLYFFGPYAKQYVETVKASYPHARALFPNDQPPLL